MWTHWATARHLLALAALITALSAGSAGWAADAIRIGHELADIGIENGRIAAIAPNLAAHGNSLDVGGRLVSPAFVETHIHLDKSAIVDRCKSERGDLDEAISEAAKAKKAFTPEDVHARARRTLEKAILQGTTHMRTHLEVDPGVELRSLDGVMPLITGPCGSCPAELPFRACAGRARARPRA